MSPKNHVLDGDADPPSERGNVGFVHPIVEHLRDKLRNQDKTYLRDVKDGEEVA